DCLAPFRLRRLQRIDFTSDYSAGLNQLIHALNLASTVSAVKHDAKAHGISESQNIDADADITGAHENSKWETNLWEEACRINTIASYKNYLNQSIKGEFKSEARLFLKQLELQQKEDEVEGLLWQKAKTEKSKKIYQHYLEEYPHGNFETLALSAIADIERVEKAEQDRVKELEKQQEKERLAREQAAKEARLKEEKEKAEKERLEREQKLKEEKEKAAKEKQEREQKLKEEKEKAEKEKQERELARQKEKEKAAKEKQERELAKQQEKEKAALLKQQEREKALKENPELAKEGTGGRRNIYIGVGVVFLILGIFGIMKMRSGNGDINAWNVALTKNDSTSFATYQAKFPNGKYYALAKSKLDFIGRANQQARDSLIVDTKTDTESVVSSTTEVKSTPSPKSETVKPTTPVNKTKVPPTVPQKQAQKLALGQNFHGGIIIALNTAGDHGLLASIKEVGNLDWETAKKVCEAYTTGTFNEWRLPTKAELNMVYLSRRYISVYTKGLYWSATEENRNNAWAQNFENGNGNKTNKSSKLAVRAVQSF
ncbi:MAG: DUF1566 domain-containing protein, partial [Saprospiraceae bacterium]